MERILVINVNWMGDVIFSTPIFKALKETYPQSQVSCLAVPRVHGILQSVPQIDEIINYDEEGIHKRFLGKLRLILRLRRKNYDIVFLLHRSTTRTLLSFCAGIPIRVGYATKKRSRFLTHNIKPLENEMHRGDQYLHLLEDYGIAIKDRASQLTVSQQAQIDIQGILQQHGIAPNDLFFIINPGGNWNLKRWPKENFQLLAHELITQYKVKIIITGALKDIDLADAIVKKLDPKPVVLAGKTNLQQMMALMKLAKLVISADSGPLHLASSLKTDTIGIYGPTRPEITGPRGGGRSVILQQDVGCNRHACYFLKCTDNICMKSVTVKDVLNAVSQIQNK